MINQVEIDNFHVDTLNYLITYPIGSDSTILISKDDIQVIPEDKNATWSIMQIGTNIMIQVTAEDGTTTSIYSIAQRIEQSSNTRLMAVYVDDVMLRDFAPEIIEYTYYITSVQPIVVAVAEDSTSTISYEHSENARVIRVEAEDGSEQIYTIHFIQSSINEAATPNDLDVLMKHIEGSNEIAFATTRKNVYVGVYNMAGQILFYSTVPTSNPNDIVIISNADGHEELIDVYTPLKTYTLPEENSIYFYVFFENGVHKITSGKFFYQ